MDYYVKNLAVSLAMIENFHIRSQGFLERYQHNYFFAAAVAAVGETATRYFLPLFFYTLEVTYSRDCFEQHKISPAQLNKTFYSIG